MSPRDEIERLLKSCATKSFTDRRDRAIIAERVLAPVLELSRLADYNRVCGFRLTGTLPVTYPHVLAFPLAMRLMSGSDFPFPVVGLVHVATEEIRRPAQGG